MSLIAARSSDGKIQKINAKQIGQALETVFAKLVPLLAPQGPFDYHASRILRNNARHLSQAVRHQLLALGHTAVATAYIMDMLEIWDEISAQARVDSLLLVNRFARIPRQHFLDSLSDYVETKMGLSMLFDQFIKENGANAAIRIEESEPSTFWNFFNVGTISALKMATDLIQNIEQLETTTLAFHQWISDIEAAMHRNLQDEKNVAAFYAPLAESPFWSMDCQSELHIDANKVESVEFEISRSADNHSNTFPNIILNLDETLQNFTTMWAQSEPPKPKVVIPEQRSYTDIPSSVLVGHVDPPHVGSFQISLEGVDKMDSKTSRVRMEMQVRAVHNRLREVAVRCRFYPKDNPESLLLHISECFPQTASDLNKDPRVEPYNCNADLELRCSLADLLEWRLSRKSSLWTRRSSVIPTEFLLSFSLTHTIDVDLEVEVEFKCQARWSNCMHHCEKTTFSLRAP